ncbi:MAG: SnoaL-like domain [Thermoleophilaceae bacterium]|jgi:ketosteroid isomerase-like protein|nr:SnoaL-like domain [Thermoleophilaceae bacterium]
MSESSGTDTVELVRLAFERFNARDADGLAALMAPDGELYPYAIDERRRDGYKGHDGLRTYIDDVGRLFAEFHVDISEYKDVGDGVVLAEGRIVGATHDRTDIDMAASWLWTVRDGKVTRMQAHPATPRRDDA